MFSEILELFKTPVTAMKKRAEERSVKKEVITVAIIAVVLAIVTVITSYISVLINRLTIIPNNNGINIAIINFLIFILSPILLYAYF